MRLDVDLPIDLEMLVEEVEDAELSALQRLA
jgi:hypothetical protein